MAFEDYSAKRNMTPEEVLAVFRELQELNPWADEERIDSETSVHDWQWVLYDVAAWNECRRSWKAVNELFNIAIPYRRWKATVKPMKERTVLQMCELIASVALIEDIRPVSVFGKKCKTAGAFLAVRNTLAKVGIDVSELRPSSPLEPLLRKHHTAFEMEMLKFAPGKLPRVKIEDHRLVVAVNRIIIAGLLLFAASLPVSLLSIYFYGLDVTLLPIVVLGVPLALCDAIFASATRSLQPRSAKLGDLHTVRDLCCAIVADVPVTD